MTSELRRWPAPSPVVWRIAALTLVVLAASLGLLWLVGRTIDRNRTTASNSQLVADVQVARATLQSDVAVAARKASALARMTSVQAALASGDTAALEALTKAHPGTLLVSSRGVRRGSLSPLGVRRILDVTAGGRTIGRIVTEAPLDASFLARARANLPQGSHDLLVVTRHGRVAAGPLRAGVSLAAPTPRTVHVDGHSDRAFGARLVSDRPELAVVALSPGASSFVSAWRLPLAVFATLFALTAFLFLSFGSFRHERRRPVRRVEPAAPGEAALATQPLGMTVDVLGEKLAATHDADALLGAILDAAIKATGAAGGRVARAGEAEPGKEVLRVPLDTDDPESPSELLLFPPPTGFGADAASIAHWLGAHASTAIRDARLHRVLQDQEASDELTGLANRRRFTTELQSAFARAERGGTPLAVVLGDLDDFRAVNERFGIGTGDEVLNAVAGILRRSVRDIDMPARIGGEEFGVLLPETDAEGARQFAERLREALRTDAGVPEFLTASFGVACFPQARSAEELLAGADACLRRAKAAGKDRVVVGDGSPQAPART